MRLSIRHTTRYSFAQPVVHALQRLRLTPKNTQGQKVLDWQMRFNGARAEVEYDDHNHNRTVLVSVEPGARSLEVHCAHSPLREVEILHDQLLARFADDPQLTPDQVVVLTQ